jgi:hypothetical protein
MTTFVLIGTSDALYSPPPHYYGKCGLTASDFSAG